MVARNLAEIIPAIFTGPNGERLTPEQIARRQEVAQSLLAQATDTSPNAGGWTSVLAKGAMGFASGWKEKQAERGAAANAKASSADTAALLDVLGGGVSAPVGAPATTNPVSVPPATSMPSTPMAANQPPIPGLQASGEGGEAYIRQGLVQRGLPEHVADAFLVNFKDESGLNPGINEQNPIVPGSRGGYGLYQLTGPRRVAYEQFAQERGVPTDNIDAQLDFLMMEGQGPERKAFESILSAPDTATAAQAIVKNFLRPSPEYRDSRMAKYASLPTSGGGYTDPMVSAPNAPRMEVAQALMPQAAPQTMTDASPQPSGGINPAVARVLSDPYADPRNVQLAQTLLTQQQAEARAAQERMLAEQQRAAEIQRRQQVAQQTGIDPAYAVDDELWKGAAGNVFAAPSTSTIGNTVVDNRTGQPIYQAPEKMYRQVSGEEAAAMGLDPSKAYNIGPNGEVRPIGEGGVVVNNNMGNDKFGEEFAKLDAVALGTVATSGLAAQRNLGRIDQLEGLLDQSPSGFQAALAQRAGEFGIPVDGLDTIQAAQAVINSLIPEQRPPGSGPMSDRDVDLFRQGLPRVINQPGGNKIIINAMRGIAQYDAEGAAIVQMLRDNKINRAQAFEMLQNRKNPLAEFKAPANQEDPLPPQPNTGKASTGVTWEIIE